MNYPQRPDRQVSLDDVRDAAKRIAGAIERTPCVHSRTLSQLTGAEVFLKFENLQFTASFKERGALNRLLLLSGAERRRGVIAMSAGNHAQGVAYHAARLGIRSVIVMPKGTPNTKVKNTREHGADVVLEGDSLAAAAEYAQQRAAGEGLTIIHPYDDPAVIAGQGTIAIEMLEDAPGLEMLIVPIGGGGLISGVATVTKALSSDVQVFGVESRSYRAMYQRLHGQPVEVGGETIADGLAVRDVGELTLEIVRRLVRDVLIVEESTIERAVVTLIEIEKTVAEGAGAAGLAALLQYPDTFRGRRVGIPLCGGNIDTSVLAAVLMRGLVRDGRLVRLRVAIPDVSGSLAKVASLIGEAGGNIVEVQHQRLFGTDSVRRPEVEFLMETRDRAHSAAIVAALRAKDVKVTEA
ncbi:MAG: threonine ammonia-lyase [Betaproteobacteria bacterium RIFCSPLOWO2_02_FULL_63_19]|nr:MAG: threonine ammonia-lyase [Betaproteobacteria bacterium RIFCSPLOWO2_02_FULL_63_19]